MQEIAEALEVAAGAGDDRISGVGIGRSSTVSQGQAQRAREIIKRFCENVSPDITASEILELLDRLDP